ncbi:MAG: hypothetical protein HYT65_02695 [Candidatus Yanofskybacteria bacterium]|nr:hypothetical protein [Candidatus Yanofskybacteria bacterium]
MGNKNGKGAKGRSGRKSYAQEKADFELLEKVFFEEHTEDEIKKMLKDKRSFYKVFKAKGLAGNEKFILALFNKIFPDRSNLNLGLVKPLPTDKADRKIKELYGIRTNDKT